MGQMKRIVGVAGGVAPAGGGSMVARNWLAAAVVVAGLLPAASRASVMYSFNEGPTVDLAFTVAKQLSLTNNRETIADVSGVYAADFSGGIASYRQGPPGYQPLIEISTSYLLEASFIGFPPGNPANGVPGNGSFDLSANIYDASFNVLASPDTAVISGVPVKAVPEPSGLLVLAFPLGFVGLLLARRRRASAIALRGGQTAR